MFDLDLQFFWCLLKDKPLIQWLSCQILMHLILLTL